LWYAIASCPGSGWRGELKGGKYRCKLKRRSIYSLSWVGRNRISCCAASPTHFFPADECSYITHGSWAILWPFQLLILKARKPHQPWSVLFKSHIHHLLTTARMIMVGSPHLSASQNKLNPVPFMVRRIVSITCVLTIAGSTWYVAVNMTTPSDLTAIYNCSAFFAYVFSIFMLKERMRADKIFSVVVACVGVLIVAYGDGGTVEKGKEVEAANRTVGNLIIGVGSVMYGFYEVLYKKAACPPDGVSASRTIIFANTVGSGLGVTTLVPPPIPPFRHPSILILNSVSSGSRSPYSTFSAGRPSSYRTEMWRG